MIEAGMGKQYCSFIVGELLVGIEVDRVREILTDQEVTPVPLAPTSVLGLLNLRGELMTVVDARRRLGLHERDGDQPAAHVIVVTGCREGGRRGRSGDRAGRTRDHPLGDPHAPERNLRARGQHPAARARPRSRPFADRYVRTEIRCKRW